MEVLPSAAGQREGAAGSSSSDSLTCLSNFTKLLAGAVEKCTDRGIEQIQPLSEEEILERIDAADSPYEWSLGTTGIKLRFAWTSQRGYYPGDLDKANQDAFKVVPSFGGSKQRFLMAVFDGHGETGDLAAGFSRDNIEETLLKLCARYPTDFKTAYRMVFMQLNQRLIFSETDVSLSGTTACACFFDGLAVHVANLGDSRAVVGERRGDKVVAVALSSDQTPYRADERKRIREAGGLVMSFEQLMGDAPMHDDWEVELGEQTDMSGDPPRIWEPESQLPGCAFTRSIGDSVAEKLGVFADPEITTRELTADDVVVVVASDGVWEFITNQTVVDMVMQFEDPLKACRSLVAESYSLWLQFDTRTDDITAIVAYIDQTERRAQAVAGDALPDFNPWA